jgi:hypothetical protein
MLKKRELLEVKKLYWALWKSSGEMEEAITVQHRKRYVNLARYEADRASDDVIRTTLTHGSAGGA